MSKKIYRFHEEDLDAHEVPESLGQISTLSVFFDAFITEVRHNMIAENLDPLNIPDGVHKEIKALIMAATLDINRIAVHNLSNLARPTDFKTDYIDRIMTITIPIRFMDVKVFADYKINAGPVVISEGRIMGRIGDLSIAVSFSIDFVNKKLIFREFGIPTSDKISVTFKGDGLSKYLLNVLTPIVIMSLKTIVLSVVKREVSTQIEEGFRMINRILEELEAERKLAQVERVSGASTSSSVK